MPRPLHRLSATKVKTLKLPGMYADGGNLWLQVTSSGAKSWIFRFMQKGRSREMGLGSVISVSLMEARRLATDCRRQVVAGMDPIVQRDAAADAARVASARTVTFKDCAESYIAAHEAGWRNKKHASQWGNTLRDYAYPVIGNLPVADVDTALVHRVLDQIWRSKTETASRVRGRIESILDWARVRGYRTGDNPARWKGNLKHLLPSESEVTTVRHHPAMRFEEVGQFMVRLRGQSGTAAKALEFAILTATRTNETLGAQWSEFDLSQSLWTIPASRMKAGKEHRVPLSDAAMQVLEVMQAAKEGPYVFPGARSDRPLSNMALLGVLRRMQLSGVTVHGFRSTFRDWAAEATSYSHEIAEMTLAHTIPNKVEAAYRRRDLYQKRALMMQDWANYCGDPSPHIAEVIPLRIHA